MSMPPFVNVVFLVKVCAGQRVNVSIVVFLVKDCA